MFRAGPAGEAGEHSGGGPANGLAADQRTDRNGGSAPLLERLADSRDGEDRADADERVARRDRDQVGPGKGLEHPRRGPRILGALEAHGIHLVTVLPADEPLLEREVAGRGLEPRAQPVVGRGQQRRHEPERRRELTRDAGERLAVAQLLRADEVEPEVAVAELEPRVGPEAARLPERVPGLVLATPAALLVQAAGERVEDRVEVRRDVEAEDLDVVADVADDRQLLRLDRLRERAGETGAAEAACEDGDLHRARPVRSASSAAAVRGPSRSSSPSRSPSVSTSSARFGIAATAAGTSSRSARARKRSALSGP